MLDQLIKNSIKYRSFVILLFLSFCLWAFKETTIMNIDVFPDLTAPTVTLVGEAHGLSAQEIETSVILPIESAMNGATGVRRVRTKVGNGVALAWVEFKWGMDIYRARQIVAEKLQSVQSSIPKELPMPVITPVTSIMGEIYFLGISSETVDSMELDSIAKWKIRRRLLAVPGVAQVINMGGDIKQLQIILNPGLLKAYKLNPLDVYNALKKTSENAGAGFLLKSSQEYLVQIIGRKKTIDQLEKAVIKENKNRPVLLKDIASITFSPAIRRGTASINAKPGIVLAIQKQPNVNTLKLTEKIDQELNKLEMELPKEVVIHKNLLRQADFIEVAVNNVLHALRDGAILVILIIGLFLMNARATFITILVIPLSMLVSTILLKLMGITLNTMTLGGLAIAVGSLVDDAIIDVENVIRRLQINSKKPKEQRQTNFEVVFQASKEIRAAIFFATLIIMLVFLPLFFLSGVEGRLLIPLGIAYMSSLAASLFIALTLTPALCMYLLPKTCIESTSETRVVRVIKKIYYPLLKWALDKPLQVVIALVFLVTTALVPLNSIGQSFLPEFQEGALTLSVVTIPGTSLEKSDQIANRVEKILLSYDEVITTSRRTGKAELDEHAMGTNASEIDVRLKSGIKNKHEFLTKLRGEFSQIIGTNITIGQPISHRIDHMLSGSRANIAIKVIGHDLSKLQSISKNILAKIESVDGVVDPSIEQKILAPAVSIHLRDDRLAFYQLKVQDVIENIEIALDGHKISDMIEKNIRIPMILRVMAHTPTEKEQIDSFEIYTPTGHFVRLDEIAKIEWDKIPAEVSRENGSRKMVVMCNVSGRDLISVVNDIKKEVGSLKLDNGYHVEYGGQFESAVSSTEKLFFYSALVFVLIFALLVLALNSARDAILVLVNLPLALIGGIFGIFIYNKTLSIASIVGMIALFGIATRNGLMLVTHYHNLYFNENVKSLYQIVYKGSMERLTPILMTALASALALVPLAMAKGDPGSEIQTPMAYVMLLGLLSSTFLNMVVLPSLYLNFGSLKNEKKKQ
ncbi:MAG: efflux RND transporter permease subunit [Flavobacteriaceae bacterium]|nr:efflux RND transporter permease subunit [Flavobacteriaceae bacterium]